jgi:hypothetical protein
LNLKPGGKNQNIVRFVEKEEEFVLTIIIKQGNLGDGYVLGVI